MLDGLTSNSSNSSGVLAQRVDVQEDGTVLIGVAIALPEDGSPVAFGYGNISVEVPSAILESLGAVGVAVLGLVPATTPLFNLLNSSDWNDVGLFFLGNERWGHVGFGESFWYRFQSMSNHDPLTSDHIT